MPFGRVVIELRGSPLSWPSGQRSPRSRTGIQGVSCPPAVGGCSENDPGPECHLGTFLFSAFHVNYPATPCVKLLRTSGMPAASSGVLQSPDGPLSAAAKVFHGIGLLQCCLYPPASGRENVPPFDTSLRSAGASVPRSRPPALQLRRPIHFRRIVDGFFLIAFQFIQ